MSVDDRGDELAELRELKRRVDRLESGSMLENSSITRGRMRFIGGLLRVDSGGRVEIVGTLRVEGVSQFVGEVTISGPWRFTGNGAITGNVVAEGKWTQNGPWEFNGDGDIAGDVDLTGDLEVLGDGRIRVGGVIISPQGGGRVTVGTGSRQIVIDASTQRIRVGQSNPMTIEVDGNGNGIVEMSTGAVMRSLPSSDVELELRSDDGLKRVVVGTNNIFMANGSRRITVGEDLISMQGVTDLPAGTSAKYMAITDSGTVYRTSGVGGGGGPGTPGPIAGEFMWPFSQSTTDPVLGFYGMRLNPVTGLWALHAGQDFSVAGGSPIPAAGDGQISAAGFDNGRGNYVIIDHGNGITTHYFHMVAPSPLSVGSDVERGDVIGNVGTTGNSTGNHLHWETHVNGTAVDPRQFMAAQAG